MDPVGFLLKFLVQIHITHMAIFGWFKFTLLSWPYFELIFKILGRYYILVQTSVILRKIKYTIMMMVFVGQKVQYL